MACQFTSKKETNASSSTTETETVDANPTEPVPIQAPTTTEIAPINQEALAKLKVDDPSYYGEDFLKELATISFVPAYVLQDGYILLGGTDTIFFPLPIGIENEQNFSGIKDSLHYTLSLKQINYTTQQFKFQKLKSDTLILEVMGEARLNAGFILGAESDEDDETGVSYLASEYGHQEEACQFNIRIGEEQGKVRVKINRYCKDKTQNITLAECPTLRRQE